MTMENKLQEIDQNGDDVSHNHTIVSTPTSSTSGCVSGDDSDGKTTVPPSLIGAGNYLEVRCRLIDLFRYMLN